MLAIAGSLQYQIIAFILIGMIMFLYSRRVKLHIYREKIFSYLYNICFLSLVLDVAAIIAAAHKAEMDAEVNLAIRRLYLISVVLVAFAVLLYTMAEVYQAEAFGSAHRYFYLLPVAMSVPLIARLAVENTQNGGFGAAVYVSMGSVVIYIIICLVYWVRHHRKLIAHRANAILFAAFIFFACGIIQLFYQQLRLMSLGIAFFLVYMYMGLETPDVYVEEQLGIFNRDAFVTYIRNQRGEGKQLSILYILPMQLDKILENAGYSAVFDMSKAMADYLKQIKGAKVFNYNDGAFVLTFEKQAYFFDRVSEVRKRFEEIWVINGGENYKKNEIELEIGAKFIAYPASRMEGRGDAFEILETLNYYIDWIKRSDTNTYMCVDRKQLAEMKALAEVDKQLARVVAEGRIDVFYQPVFSIQDNSCCELEALVRIRDSKDVYFENRHIIPMAERSGEIINIGYEVFRQICKFMTQNRLADMGIKRVAVNLSMIQCQQKDLGIQLAKIMENYRLTASNFRFEISIKTIDYMTSNLSRNINYLTSLGAEFAIDDYGNTGIDTKSILAVSKTYIKLGERSVRDYFSQGKSKQQLRAACRILQQMSFQVAAVGVETQQQYAELKKLGVTHMQGNAFYRPMAGEDLLKALSKEQAADMGQQMLAERII